MIRKATQADKQTIYRIWKEMFAHDDNGYTDFYFQHRFETKNTWVVEEDKKIVSTMQINPHHIMLGGKKIQASMILGVATLPAHQKKGHMRALLEEAIQVTQSQEMITFIQAYNPAIYRQFGFHMQYYRQTITYQSSDIPRYPNLKVNSFVDSKGLADIYAEFASRFDGYYVRNEAYFKTYDLEVASEGGKFAVYRNQDNEIEGYMVYYLDEDKCEVRELIYLNSWALYGLLGFASKLHNQISVQVSSSEQLLKLIPNGTSQQVPFMMARINDIPLFNICFDTSIHNVDEAFAVFAKPLWVHEYA